MRERERESIRVLYLYILFYGLLEFLVFKKLYKRFVIVIYILVIYFIVNINNGNNSMSNFFFGMFLNNLF